MVIAELTVRPIERMLTGPNGSASLEPLAMSLFVELATRAGTLITRRDLFHRLWGSLAVGDDNLNRLVAALRRTLNKVGATSVSIQTVPANGYILRLQGLPCSERMDNEVNQAVSEAFDSWRLGLPEPDHLRIALLERAVSMGSQGPRLFGMLALLYRHAAEYSAPNQAGEHVRSCEGAARRALELDIAQVEASTALASIAPLYGHWTDACRRLTELCDATPGHPVPENDLSVVEMATGQIAAAKHRRDRLIAADPLAAHFCYKSVYQHWSIDDLVGMDHVADRAMQLWPLHPAVWTARFWTFAYTGRFPAAQSIMSRSDRPSIPEPMLAFLRQVVSAATSGQKEPIDRAVAAATALASGGPTYAVAALFGLGLFGRIDDAFAVARSYYLHGGDQPVPLQPQADHPKLNEQHRRLTQVLFTPVCAAMRDDPRFSRLCESIGLTAFWNENGVTPDYLL